MITTQEFCYIADKALDSMIGIVSDLGDDLANSRPRIEAANSPYAIVNHCLGVMAYWAGHVVAGRQIHRDRDAEFTASGPVAELIERVELARTQLHSDVATVQPGSPPRGTVTARSTAQSMAPTQGAILLHVYEELAQHLGQLELTRDVLLSDR